MLHAGVIAPLPIIGLTETGISGAASAIVGVPLGFAVTVVVSLFDAGAFRQPGWRWSTPYGGRARIPSSKIMPSRSVVPFPIARSPPTR